MLKKLLGLGGLELALLVSTVQALPVPVLSTSFGLPGDDATFDYVVVGGGNAGLTVATRLVQQGVGTVAIIEAGSFYELTNGNVSTIPAIGAQFSGKNEDDWQPLVDWGYDTTPQAGANGNPIHFARGKTLGGCSARNYMVYHRATVGAYDRWADQVGDDSFAFDSFINFYKKSINFTEPNMGARLANSTPHYTIEDIGDGVGPLSLTYSNSITPFSTQAVEGFAEIGLPEVNGHLSGSLFGTSYALSTINAQTMNRDTSETSFLREGLQDPALTVYLQAQAKRVLFDENKKATGVEVDTEGFTYTLSARKEVILSTGVIGTPQLLMLSGVGPSETLTPLDIPIVADRPGVGQGMVDHIFSGIGYRVDSATLSTIDRPEGKLEQGILYNTNGTGMYANTNTEVLAFEKIPERLRANWTAEVNATLAALPDDWPEIEYISIPSLLTDMADSRAGSPPDGFQYATLSFAMIAPMSRGGVTINSSDFHVHPLINPNYFTAESDVAIAVAGFKRAREFFASDAIAPHLVGEEYYPGASVQTDEEIAEFIRGAFNGMWHGTSTAAMGKVDNPLTVVDSQARVLGVEGLRVVDASAFPFLPPGHPMSTVYAFAEKIACDISQNC
ncbi:GMC oxidoreductase [Phlyctema vagabunda]|uniref:GMC oxidoreductase n=1 Tax=Phlyctema vagabunda TaxID=108571 RepID=A0ABR4P3S9_9HELO